MRWSAGRAAGSAALAAALVAAAGALLPLAPALVSTALDDSFAATLHFAAASGPAATPLVSTFGPLGFAFHDFYWPGTFAWLWALQLAFAAVLCWALAWIGWRALGSPWGGALALFACAPLLAPPDARFLVLASLPLWVALAPGGRAPAALPVALGAAIGLAGLVKVTFLAAGLVVLAPLALAEVFGRRRAPLAPAAAGAAAACGWVAVGLGGADAVAYLGWWLRDVVPGYARAMQVPTSALLTAHGAVAAAGLAGAGAALARRRMGRAWPAAALALAGLSFLLFKAGFVRADVHVFVPGFALLAMGLLLALLAWREPRQRALALAVLAAGPLALVGHALRAQGPPTTGFRAILPPEAARRLAALPGALRGAGMAEAHARRLAEARAELPLPPLAGPVDVYPFGQGGLLAHALDFRPRPVFQSYMAYTPRLARANAAALLGERAPEWIAFQSAPIDHRFPALDDAPSWPLLLARYQLAGRAGEFALLRRRAAPLRHRLEPLAAVRTSTGRPVAVPPASQGPIWAEVDVEETPRDRLEALALAAPLVLMQVELGDGRTRHWSLVADLAREGFLLSPLVEDTDAFARLVQGGEADGGGVQATSLALAVESMFGAAQRTRAVEVQFFRLLREPDPQSPPVRPGPGAPSVANPLPPRP